MPIKPENRSRYPAKWPQIRARILERADHHCEGSPAFPDCRAPNHWWRVNATGQFLPSGQIGDYYEDELTRIVLTVAHLDHTPENCADENLRAWCQRCHLTYDAQHHAQTAYATRRIGRAAGDMFE